MRRAIWVPADRSKEIVTVDIDEAKYQAYAGFKEGDPYRIGQVLHHSETGSMVWQEKVNTPFSDVIMMVDEEGLLKGSPHNQRANILGYPLGRIYGDALFCHIKIVWHTDGPDLVVQDFGDAFYQSFTSLLNQMTGAGD